jgi:radical SAM-linked protein
MQGFTARVTYRKTGPIRLIGHLDTARALLRAVRRAAIHGVYSQGFSPRLKLSFGPALPLGCTSECEFFDIPLARPFGEPGSEPGSIKRSLESHLPEGISVEKVQVLEGNPPPLIAAFWAAEYEVEVPNDRRASIPDVERVTEQNEAVVRGAGQPRNEGTTPAGCLVRVRRHEEDDGTQVFSIVLRQDASCKGGLKKNISEILGIPRESLENCRIHKKRVYENGEPLSP